MSEKPPSKDEALEALDFIVNVLKEHEKDLDKLVNELGTVADQLGDTGEINGKVEKIEEKITGLQTEVGSLIKRLSTQQGQPQQALTAPTTVKAPERDTPASPVALSGIPLRLQCKQWEDFQNLASEAQAVSFICKETDRTFEAGAVKNNQVITFSGEIPKLAALIKTWLSKELEVSEKRVLEGALALA